jgi:hypothetical protein
VLTSLESAFEAGSKLLARNVRHAVAESSEALVKEIHELRKALIRLQATVAQTAGMASSSRRRGPVRLCLVEGCGRKHAAKGLCQNHYQQWLNRKKKEGPGAATPGGVPRRLPRRER